MAELGGVLLKHLRLHRLQSSLLFLLPSFPCSMHKESKLEAQAWKKGWRGNRGRKLKLTLKKKYTAKTSQFLCVISLSNFLYFSSFLLCLLIFASSVLEVASNVTPQICIPTTHLFFFNPLLSLSDPPFSQGEKEKLFSVVDCVCSPACWLGDLTPWACSP